MYKKISLAVTLVLLAALALSSTAFAASSSAETKQANRIGVITEAGFDSFTIQTSGGQMYTIKVNAQTVYQRVSGGAPSFRNMNVGLRVAAIGTIEKRGVLAAQTVVVMPPRINHHNWIGKRAYGKVVAINAFASSFTLQTGNGLMIFKVDENTGFLGNSVRHFSAMEVGMKAVVGYTVLPDGSLYARGVAAY